MSDNVRLGYASSSNITFRGVIETDISREDWNTWTEKEQDDFIAEQLHGLVDIYVKD